MIGAASYLLAVVLLGFGGAKLFHSQLARRRRAWCGSRSSSSPAPACFNCKRSISRAGARRFNIQGPGGWVGYSLGKKLLQAWMGGVGSIILLTGIYVSSLILMTGLRPIHIVRQTVAGMRSGDAAIQRMATESAAAQSLIWKGGSRSASRNWRSSSD